MGYLYEIFSPVGIRLRLLLTVALIVGLLLSLAFRDLIILPVNIKVVLAVIVTSLIYTITSGKEKVFLATAAVTITLLIGASSLPIIELIRPELVWKESNIIFYARPRLGDYLLLLLYLLPILLALSFTVHCMRVNKSHQLASILLNKAPDPSRGIALGAQRERAHTHSSSPFLYQDREAELAESLCGSRMRTRYWRSHLYLWLSLVLVIGAVMAWLLGVPYIFDTQSHRYERDRSILQSWCRGECSDYTAIHALERLVKLLQEEGELSRYTVAQLEAKLGLDNLHDDKKQEYASMRLNTSAAPPILSIVIPEHFWLRLFIEESGGVVSKLRLSIDESRIYDIFIEMKKKQLLHVDKDPTTVP